MHGIRFVVGRPRGSQSTAIASVVFDASEWNERDARAWLDRNDFKVRLERSGKWWRAPQRDASEFQARSFHTIDTGRREKVTMASNSRKTPRKAGKGGKKRRSAKRRNRARGKVTRTTTKSSSTRVVKTNARKVRKAKRRPKRRKAAAHRRPPARRKVARSSTRYTIAFTPQAAREFARVANLSRARRREFLRSLRRHPRGGVYPAAASWQGSRDLVQRVAARVQTVLTYAAGRRRATLRSVSAPRVVAVP